MTVVNVDVPEGGGEGWGSEEWPAAALSLNNCPLINPYAAMSLYLIIII